MKQEPQIFRVKPMWDGLEELYRKNGLVTFKTKHGKLVASEASVDRYAEIYIDKKR